MKTFLFCVSLLLFTASCSLFKQTTKTTDKAGGQTNQVNQVQASSNQISTDKSQRLLLLKDTIKDNYAIRFWPKGMLKFSPYGGLEGEFDSVLMNGNLNILRNSSEMLTHNREQKAIVSGSLKQTSSNSFWRNQAEKISQWNWKWVITGIILLLLGLIWLFRERFFLKK